MERAPAARSSAMPTSASPAQTAQREANPTAVPSTTTLPALELGDLVQARELGPRERRGRRNLDPPRQHRASWTASTPPVLLMHRGRSAPTASHPPRLGELPSMLLQLAHMLQGPTMSSPVLRISRSGSHHHQHKPSRTITNHQMVLQLLLQVSM